MFGISTIAPKLVPKVQTKATDFIFENVFDLLFRLCECSTFFFINEIFKTQNLSGGMFFY